MGDHLGNKPEALAVALASLNRARAQLQAGVEAVDAALEALATCESDATRAAAGLFNNLPALAGGPPTKAEVQLAIAAWNAAAEAHGLPRVQTVEGARLVKLTARLSTYGLDGWRDMLTKISTSRFLRGEASGGNHEGWRCTFDYVIRATPFLQIREGQFDDARRGRPGGDVMSAVRNLGGGRGGAAEPMR